MTGAPSAVELDANLDTRATDDEQRAALAPVFRKGIALFVDARHPSAVDVVLSVPKTLAGVTEAGSPWGIELGLSGQGNYTAQYRTLGGSVHLVGRAIDERLLVQCLPEARIANEQIACLAVGHWNP